MRWIHQAIQYRDRYARLDGAWRFVRREHLLDSNLDWGQDLQLVRSFMEEEGLEEINLVFFGTLWPERLGINYGVPSGRELTSGWYAVSVNYVMGRPHLVHLPEGGSRAVDSHFAFTAAADTAHNFSSL